MDTRKEMLRVAEAQLQESPDRDISTRAVCEAVGVGAPVLYRLFGDKNGLLSAVVDRAFQRYLASKRTQTLSDDPVADLYSAWDAHVAFALKNQAVYRIAYAPALKMVPAGVTEARLLLLDRLVRCAEVGRLNASPEQAAEVMMTACTGLSLSLITQPETFRSPTLSDRLRDAVLRDLLTETDTRRDDDNTMRSVALQMSTMLRTTQTGLTEPEVSVMQQWLDDIASADDDAKELRSERGTKASKRRRS
jgi:AcrR family transcriptional regulator